MLEFERLKKRNLDYLLLETIKQVGASNYSLVARLTGLNPETVRYKISKQLSKFGLALSVNINYGELGFALGVLSVKTNPAAGKSWLERARYLMLVGKVMSADRYVCLYGVPYRFKKKYSEVFEELQKGGTLESYDITELYWARYPPFRSEMYDFEKKSWTIDWRRIDSTVQEAGVTLSPVNHDSKVDLIDLKILKYLRENPTTGLAKIGKEIDSNPRTVRYHHAEHVIKGKLLIGNNIRWIKPLTEGKTNEIMQILATFKGLGPEEMATVRKLFNKLPFTWFEGGTEGRDYFAFLDIPILNFHETMSYIEARVGDLRSKYEMTMLDPAKTEYMTLPDEMFDSRLGWMLYDRPKEPGQAPKEEA